MANKKQPGDSIFGQDATIPSAEFANALMALWRARPVYSRRPLENDLGLKQYPNVRIIAFWSSFLASLHNSGDLNRIPLKEIFRTVEATHATSAFWVVWVFQALTHYFTNPKSLHLGSL